MRVIRNLEKLLQDKFCNLQHIHLPLSCTSAITDYVAERDFTIYNLATFLHYLYLFKIK